MAPGVFIAPWNERPVRGWDAVSSPGISAVSGLEMTAIYSRATATLDYRKIEITQEALRRIQLIRSTTRD